MDGNTSIEEKLPVPLPSSNRSLWTGILLTVLGIVAIALPVVSSLFIETWVALILLSSGAAKLVYAYQTREQGSTVWKALLGILYGAAGAMLFIYPRFGVLTLTLLLGSFLFTEGVFELILALQVRPRKGWIWLLINALTTLVLGGMIWLEFPFNAPWVLGTLLGISILFTGITRLSLSLSDRNLADNSGGTSVST
ncbi:MAG: HdeD family acid-resistance protein [Cyanobacteria bacterium P01_C01_bin.120]